MNLESTKLKLNSYYYFSISCFEKHKYGVWATRNKEKILELDKKIGLISEWIRLGADSKLIQCLIDLGCSFKETSYNKSPLQSLQKEISVLTQNIYFLGNDIVNSKIKNNFYNGLTVSSAKIKQQEKNKSNHLRFNALLDLISFYQNTNDGISFLVEGIKEEFIYFRNSLCDKTYLLNIFSYIKAIQNQTQLIGWKQIGLIYPNLGNILNENKKYFDTIEVKGQSFKGIKIDTHQNTLLILEKMTFFDLIQEHSNLQNAIPTSHSNLENSSPRKHRL